MAAVSAPEVDTAPPAETPLVGARPGGRWWAWALAAGAAAYFYYAPVLLRDSAQRTLATVFMFAALAQGWNVIGGFTGYPSFGQHAFFGLGGYTVAVLMAKWRWSFWPSLPVAIAFGAAFAFLVGLPVLRLRGHYFAIATLGVAEGLREIVINLPRITGGGAGITVPAVGSLATTPYPGNTAFYYFFLTLAIGSTLVVWLIARSRFGYALRAIHQDEEGAASVGINTTRAKRRAFMISGAITATAGALFAFQQVTVYPDPIFSVSDYTVLPVVMAVIGGTGTVLGPLGGGVALAYLSEWLRSHYTELHTFIFGAIIIVGVIFLPEGASNFVREVRKRRRLPFLDNVRRYRL